MAETTNISTAQEDKTQVSHHAGGKRVQSGGTRRTVILTVCIALAILLAAGGIVGGYALVAYDNIYPGVRVEDLDLSGLSRVKALELVASYYSSRTPAQPFDITIGEHTYSLALTSEDMGYDARKTVEQAYFYGRQGGVFKRLGAILSGLRGGAAVPPSLVIQDGRLELKVADIARQVNQEIAQSAYTFENNQLIIDKGQAGTSVDEKQLLGFLKDRMLNGDFSNTTFALSENAPDVLNLLLIKSEIEQEMKNPTLDLAGDPTGGKISPAQTGIYMDLEAAKKAVDQSAERYVEIPLEITQPIYTTEQFQSYLFRDVLGEGSSKFDANLLGRTKNVRLAADLCNDVILNPGDVFSFNDAVGRRTYERGFMDATIYVGDEAEDGVGGGICQVTSTIYYATLRADLEIVERKNHSRIVTYVPRGEDATVAWGYIDYRFRNNTDFPLKVSVTHGKNTMKVQLIGTQLTPNKEVKIETVTHSTTPYEKVLVLDETLPLGTEKKRDNGYTGYKTESYRVVYVDGKEISRTFENKSTYRKYDEVWLHNPGPQVPVDGQIPADGQTPAEGQIPVDGQLPGNEQAAGGQQPGEQAVVTDPTPSDTLPAVTTPTDPTPANPELPDPLPAGQEGQAGIADAADSDL